MTSQNGGISSVLRVGNAARSRDTRMDRTEVTGRTTAAWRECPTSTSTLPDNSLIPVADGVLMSLALAARAGMLGNAPPRLSSNAVWATDTRGTANVAMSARRGAQ